MKDNLNRKILPQGFYDTLFPEAMQALECNVKALKTIEKFGYQLVDPCFMEFEEQNLSAFGAKNYKVTDSLSDRMMVIREDITPQIIRLVRDNYFDLNFAEKPLRISYSGDVFKKKGKGKYKERQITQTGFEIISNKKSQYDVEVIYMAWEVLENLGLSKDSITFDFNIPNLLDQYFEKNSFSEDDRVRIERNIDDKNFSALCSDEVASEINEIIKIYDKADDVESAIKVLDEISGIIDFDSIKYLKEIFENLAKELPEIKLSFNLFEKMDFSYHNDVCYTVISSKTLEEVGRGGRYVVKSVDKNADAVGFTFNMNSLLRVAEKAQGVLKVESAGYNQGLRQLKELREKGLVTVYE